MLHNHENNTNHSKSSKIGMIFNPDSCNIGLALNLCFKQLE